MQRLTEIDYASERILFTYDPLGRRVRKLIESTSGSVISNYSYHYDGSEIAVEYQLYHTSTTWTYYLGASLDHVVLRTGSTGNQWY